MFLNSDASNIVQHVSLVLEIIGFSLAYTEWKHPAKAGILRDYFYKIDFFHDYWKRLDRTFEAQRNKDNRNRNGFGSALEPDPWIAGCFQIFFAIFLWALLGFFIILEVILFFRFLDEQAWKRILVFLVVALSMPVYFTFILRWFNKVSKGRPVGAIGVFLAILGILGEVYQLLVYYFECS